MDYVAVDTLICNMEDTVWGAVLVFFTNTSPSYKVSFCAINNLQDTISKEFGTNFYEINRRSFININLEDNGNCTMSKYRKVNLPGEELVDFDFNRESIVVEPYKIASFIDAMVVSNARYIPVGEVPTKKCSTMRFLKDMDFDEITLSSWITYRNEMIPITTPSGNLESFQIMIHKSHEEVLSGYGVKFTRLEADQEYLVGLVDPNVIDCKNDSLVKIVFTEPFRLEFVGVPISMLLVHQRRLDASLIQYATYKRIDSDMLIQPPISVDNHSNSYRTTSPDTTAYPVFKTKVRRYSEEEIVHLRDMIMETIRDYRAEAPNVDYFSYSKYRELARDWGEIPVYSVSQAIVSSHRGGIRGRVEMIRQEVSQVINSCIIINIVKKAVRLFFVNYYKEMLTEYEGILDELMVYAYVSPGVQEMEDI